MSIVRTNVVGLSVLWLVGCARAFEPADGSDASDATRDGDGFTQDDGTFDTGMGDAIARDSDAGEVGVTSDAQALPYYDPERVQSPVNEAVRARWQAIAGATTGPDDHVFMKVGASNTVNTNFAQCFAGTNVDLAGHTEWMPALDYYRMGRAGTTTPFDRTSLTATVGWSAWSALAGTPAPLDQEIAAIHPAVAIVMFGTNDIQSRTPARYTDNLLEIAQRLVGAGIIPVFTSVPPRDDDPAADLWVPRYNAIGRAVAASNGVPFIDLERVLRTLPAHGLGPDGIHMNTYTVSGAPRGCLLTAEGLNYGFNNRNRLTIEALARLRGVLDGTVSAQDPNAQLLEGNGTAAAPFIVPKMPFSLVGNTRTQGTRAIDRYVGCNATQDESGPELYYSFVVTSPVQVRAMALSRAGVDVDIHLLDARTTAQGCISRNNETVIAMLTPGTYHLVVDTFVSGGIEQSGEFVVLLLPEP